MKLLPKRQLGIPDAAQHAGVSRFLVHLAMQRGELRHMELGGRRFTKVRWIREWKRDRPR